MAEKELSKEIADMIINTMRADSLTLNQALTLIAQGKEKAGALGVPVVIAVVDGGGNLIAQHRMDDALIGSILISQSKAYTAAALKTSTRELAKSAQPGQPLSGISELGGGRFCIFGGGVPIMRNGRCIGGLGVSGGTAEQDCAIAEAAVG